MSRNNLLRLIVLLAILGVWELVGRLNMLNPLILSYPSQIFETLVKIFASGDPTKLPNFYHHLETTLYEAVVAFALCLSVGLILGLTFGLSKFASNAYEPFLLAFYSFPFVVLLPLVYLFLGIGAISNITIGFILGFFYVAFNTAAAIRQVELGLPRLARSFGYGSFTTFYKVMVPSAAPTMMSGFRQGFGHTYVGVIVGEILLPNVGLGYLIEWSTLYFYIPELYAIILLIIAIGAVVDAVFRSMEGRMQRWRRV